MKGLCKVGKYLFIILDIELCGGGQSKLDQFYLGNGNEWKILESVVSSFIENILIPASNNYNVELARVFLTLIDPESIVW